jgi:hypothetical protein
MNLWLRSQDRSPYSSPSNGLVSLPSSMALQPSEPWQFFSCLIPHTVIRTPWMGDQPIARPIPAHRTAQTQNTRTQTSMPRVEIAPMNPVFERAKMVTQRDHCDRLGWSCREQFTNSDKREHLKKTWGSRCGCYNGYCFLESDNI